MERSARLPVAVPVERRPVERRPVRPRPRHRQRLWAWVQSVPSRLVTVAARRPDRGDVPGWVLVTLMTAGLVLVLWGVARNRLTEVFNDAIDSVIGGTR